MKLEVDFFFKILFLNVCVCVHECMCACVCMCVCVCLNVYRIQNGVLNFPGVGVTGNFEPPDMGSGN